MDIHLKKLNEIKRANTVKRVDDTKKVDEYLIRRHMDKMRTAEFEKQGKILSFQAFIERDMEVNRGNKKLLERLVEISKGKHVSDLLRLILHLALSGATDPGHGHRLVTPSLVNVPGVFPPEVPESGC